MILIIFLLCLFATLMSYIWNNNNQKKFQMFINFRYSPLGEALLNFFTFFLLYNTMIPISLIISLEMVKFV